MSLDISVHAKRDVELFVSNITYNLSPMYYRCFKLEKGIWSLDGMSCEKALPYIREAIKDMKENKEEYEKLNPKNGWGSYDGLLERLESLELVCIDNLDGRIEVV